MRERSDGAFAEPIGQHAESEKALEPLFSKVKSFRGFSNTPDFSKREVFEKAGFPEPESVFRRQNRMNRGRRRIERKSMPRRSLQPAPRSSKVWRGLLRKRGEFPRGFLDQFHAVINAQRRRRSDLLSSE